MRLGTMTSLFRDQRGSDKHISYIESMTRCRQAGFTVLDFNMCALPRKKTELHGEDWRNQVDLILTHAQKLGVEFSQAHSPYRVGREGGFKSQEEKDFFNKMALRAIEICSLLGVKWTVLHPVTAVGALEYRLEENIAFNQQTFEKEIDLALKLNVGVAFENMRDQEGRRRFGTTAQELEGLMDAYNHPLVGICWDVGHAHRMHDDQVSAIMHLGKRIKALHIDDNYAQQDLHMMPFLGDIQWEQVMKALYQSGYEGDFIYEIRLNENMPDALKDISAKYCYQVGEYLMDLAK